MLARRLVVCLDVAGGKVVKGVQFESLAEQGDPAELALRYDAEGADEIVFLNIASANEDRAVLVDTVRRAADKVFIPMTVGGGVSSVSDAADLLRAGADKVSINSAAVVRPSLITETANVFGAQCVVASIDARRENGSWRVYTRGGRQRTSLDAVKWAKECEERGAGEILLTSIDRDGTRNGYDVDLTRSVADEVSVPVVASGGGGSARDVVDVIDCGGADAALMAGALHDGSCRIVDIKRYMQQAGLRVRATA
jgi:cyclase